MIKSSVVTDRTRPERRMTAKVPSIVSSTSKHPCGTVCHSSECTGTTHLPTNEARALRASKVLGASNVGLRGTFRVPGGLSLNLAHQDLMPLSDDALQVGGNRIAKSIA